MISAKQLEARRRSGQRRRNGKYDYSYPFNDWRRYARHYQDVYRPALRKQNRARGKCACGREPKPDHKSCVACLNYVRRAHARKKYETQLIRGWLVCCASFDRHRWDCKEANHGENLR